MIAATDYNAPGRMDQHERMRMRSAVFRATRLYPGPVGALIAQEITAWEEFGFRLGNGSQITALVNHVLTTPMPHQAT